MPGRRAEDKRRRGNDMERRILAEAYRRIALELARAKRNNHEEMVYYLKEQLIELEHALRENAGHGGLISML